MGKRSNFDRVERDYYPTPISAVEPLAPFLPTKPWQFIEPCAGDGRLAQHISRLSPMGYCVAMYDIEPNGPGIVHGNALELREEDLHGAEYIITNPPWNRKLLHPIIERLCGLAPTWLLFDADWIHTMQSAELVKNHLTMVVSVGRVKWIEGSKSVGKDNCAWHLFERNGSEPASFHGRRIKGA